MPSPLRRIYYALLTASWTVVGACLVHLYARADAEIAQMTAVQAANALVLLRMVWPREVEHV